MKSKLAALAFTLALAGCAATSDVQKQSGNTYQVTEKASAAQGGVEAARRKALKTAVAYCRAKGKQVTLMNNTTAPATSAGGAATLTFMCG